MRRVAKGQTRSLLEILTEAWESSGKKPKELDIPKPPEEMRYLLNLFWELKRSSEPVQWHELESWQRMTGQQLEQGEISLLMQLDDTHTRVINTEVTESEANAVLKHETQARLRAVLRAAGK